MFKISLLLAIAACGEVKSGGADANTNASDSSNSAVTAPAVTITTPAIAGAPIQCKVTTPSVGGVGPISYSATWTQDAAPFPAASTTVFANDTVPGPTTHTNKVFGCTVTATDGQTTAVATPATVTVEGRFAYVIVHTATTPTMGVLNKINLDNTQMLSVGPTGVNYSYGDLAWDPNHKVMYMIDGQAANALYRVNTTTGVATRVGVHGVANMGGLVYDPGTDRLFGTAILTTPSLFSINPINGAATAIGGPNTFLDGMAFDTKRHMLVGITNSNLVTIDLVTGNQTALATSGAIAVNSNGLTYDPITDLLWLADASGRLFSYDPSNNYLQTLVTTFSGAPPMSAISFPPPAP